MNKVKISANFSLHEFEVNDGSHLVMVDEALISKLQRLRELVNLPIEVHSGYRTPAYNKKIGGSPNSQHMLGKAADISIKGLTPTQVAVLAEQVGFKGIGIYDKSGFVHVDCRPEPARWRE